MVRPKDRSFLRRGVTVDRKPKLEVAPAAMKRLKVVLWSRLLRALVSPGGPGQGAGLRCRADPQIPRGECTPGQGRVPRGGR